MGVGSTLQGRLKTRSPTTNVAAGTDKTPHVGAMVPRFSGDGEWDGSARRPHTAWAAGPLPLEHQADSAPPTRPRGRKTTGAWIGRRRSNHQPLTAEAFCPPNPSMPSSEESQGRLSGVTSQEPVPAPSRRGDTAWRPGVWTATHSRSVGCELSKHVLMNDGCRRPTSRPDKFVEARASLGRVAFLWSPARGLADDFASASLRPVFTEWVFEPFRTPEVGVASSEGELHG